MSLPKIPWKVSLHGGHSRAYCDHATSDLHDMLDAAVDFGYAAFGITEHCPRMGEEFLYPTEIDWGWTVETVCAKFAQYASDVRVLQREYADRIKLIRGFEIEVVPEDRYIELMLGFRAEYDFEYMVGSVHHIGGIMIDFDQPTFLRAADKQGGVEALAVRYYEVVAEMVSALRPEVVGHLDLICKCAPSEEAVTTPACRKAAFHALQAILDAGSILDINTAGYRKHLGRPYVAPWLLEAATQLGVPVCFGDDSHCVDDVGAGIEDARAYLIANGITSVQFVGEESPRSLVD